jgi:hypothetical protein
MISFALLLVYQTVILINTHNIDSKHKELLAARNKAGLAINGLLLQSSTTQRMILNMALSANPGEQKEHEQNIILAENATAESFRALESTLSHFSDEGSSICIPIQL